MKFAKEESIDCCKSAQQQQNTVHHSPKTKISACIIEYIQIKLGQKWFSIYDTNWVGSMKKGSHGKECVSKIFLFVLLFHFESYALNYSLHYVNHKQNV